MPKINILNSTVYNRISAGEVVENPAAIVKELVENSIDAGATLISVDVKGGGIKEITVNDNGCGIAFEDLPVAFMPHSTSKISTVEDLDSINTLGFRGEALTSIAAVAMVTLRSKTSDAEMGGIIEINGGNVERHLPEASPNGTYITIRNLFYNTPARAKFLRSQKREETEIRNIISRIILANPNISIKYNVDGKNIFYSSGKNLESAFCTVYGINELKQYYAVHNTYAGMSITGYISIPENNKPNKTYQTAIVNGRYVVSPFIASAVQNAYGDMVMKRSFPAFILFLNIDSNAVDVNVHPRKLDIKFSDTSKVYYFIFTSVKNCLLGKVSYKDKLSEEFNDSDTKVQKIISEKNYENIFEPHLKEEFTESSNSFTDNRRIIESNDYKETKTILNTAESHGKSSILNSILMEFKNNTDHSISSDKLAADLNQDISNSNAFETESEKFKQSEMEMDIPVRFIGIIFDTYLLFQSQNDLYLIDQHAAHERIIYDKLLNSYKNKNTVSQPMLIPYYRNLNPMEFNYISENFSILNDLGFEIEEYGENVVRVLSVPVELTEISLNKFFDDILKNIFSYKKTEKSDILKDKIMQAACKAAVKGGDKLADEEVKYLIKEISINKRILYCPHGRPIIVNITKEELEKKFKRLV